MERYKAQDSWDINPLMDKEGLDYLQEIIKSAGELQKPVDSNLLITRQFAGKVMMCHFPCWRGNS